MRHPFLAPASPLGASAPSLLGIVRRRCSACGARASARCRAAAPSRTLDPVVVTAARGPQPIADVARRRHRHRRATKSRAPACRASPSCCSGSPASRSSQNGGPGSRVGRVPARRQPRPDAGADRRPARRRRRRAGATSLEAIPLDQIERIEILRGPASSLYGADAIGGVIQVFTRRGDGALVRQRAARATAPTTPGTASGRRRRHARAACDSRCRRRRQASARLQRDRRIPATFATTPTATATTAQSVSANARRTAWAPSRSLTAQYSTEPPQHPVRRRPGLRRPHDHDRRDVAGREPQPARVVLGVAALASARAATTACRRRASATSRSRRRSGSTPGRTTSTLPLGALSAGVSSGARSASRPIAGFRGDARATRTRSFGVYQLRVDAHALQANLRHDDSSQYGGKTTGAHRATATAFVAGVARHRGLQHRLQGAVVQRSLLSRASPIRTSCRKRRSNVEVGVVLERRRRRRAASRRARSATTTG